MLGNFSNSNGSNPTEWVEIKTNQQIKDLEEALSNIQEQLDALSDRLITEDIEANTASVNNIDVGNATISSAAVTDTLGVNHLQANDIQAVSSTIPIINGTTNIEEAHIETLQVQNPISSLDVGSLSTTNLAVSNNLILANVNASSIDTDDISSDTATIEGISTESIAIGDTSITEKELSFEDDFTLENDKASIRIDNEAITLESHKDEEREVERNGTIEFGEDYTTYYDENGDEIEEPEEIVSAYSTITLPIHYVDDTPYYQDDTEVEDEYTQYIEDNAIVVYNIYENGEDRFEFENGDDASDILVPDRIEFPYSGTFVYKDTQIVTVDGTINLESPVEANKLTASQIYATSSSISQASILDLQAYKIYGSGKLNVNPEMSTVDDWVTVEVPEYKNAVVLLNGSYNGNKWTITITRAGKAGTVIYASDTIDLIKDISYEYSGRCRCRVKATEYVYYSIYTTEESPEELICTTNGLAYEDYIFVSTTLNGYTFIAFGDNTLSMHFPGRFSADYINMGTAEFDDFTISLAKINMLGLPDMYDDMGNVNTRTSGSENQYIRVSNTTVTPPGSPGLHYLEYQSPIDDKVEGQSDVLVTEKAVAKYDGSSENEDEDTEYNIVHLGDGTVVHGDGTLEGDLDVDGDTNIDGTLDVTGITTLKNSVRYENDGVVVETVPAEELQVTLYSDDQDTWYTEDTLENEYDLSSYETVDNIQEVSPGLYSGDLKRSIINYTNSQGTDKVYLKNTFVDEAVYAHSADASTDAINALYATNDVNGDQIDTTYIKLSEKGVATGVATLDATGRLPKSQLPVDDLTFEGMWDASTNNPTLQDGVGTKGDFYVVSVAGSQDLGSGTISFVVNDRVLYDGSVWIKLKAGNVDSVNGQTPVNGNVEITGEDIPISSTSTHTVNNLFWTVTKAEYDALATIDPEIFYFITEV